MKSAKRRARIQKFVPVAGGTLLVVVLVGAMVWGVQKLRGQPGEPQRQTVQVVKLLRPPPPPPEPPPPPPPEDKLEEPLPQDMPDPVEDDSAPSPDLGLDADGVAGSDGFGLAARKGGRDLLGGSGAVFAWYTGLVKDGVLSVLSADERIRRGNYSVTVRVWLANDGRVEQIRLGNSTGSGELDRAIQVALQSVPPMREGPPLEMPQPITLRIVSRG